jgi:hypothetical protein
MDKNLGVVGTDWKIPALNDVSIVGDRVLEMDESEPTVPRHVLRRACCKSCDCRKAAGNLMNRMMNYCCSKCCSVCLCAPSLTQSTTDLQAAILPSIPLPAARANPLVEREHPKIRPLCQRRPFRERHL